MKTLLANLHVWSVLWLLMRYLINPATEDRSRPLFILLKFKKHIMDDHVTYKFKTCLKSILCRTFKIGTVRIFWRTPKPYSIYTLIITFSIMSSFDVSLLPVMDTHPHSNYLIFKFHTQPKTRFNPLAPDDALWHDGCRSIFRADSRLAPSQSETSLQSSTVYNWLGISLESALTMAQHWFRLDPCWPRSHSQNQCWRFVD